MVPHHPRFTCECNKEEINDDDHGAAPVTSHVSKVTESALFGVMPACIQGYLAHKKQRPPRTLQ